jgi:hypothetical protein
LTNLATAGTFSEHPLSNPPAHNTKFRRVAAKRRNGIKKPSGVNRRKSTVKCVIQFGVRIPEDVKQALQFDSDNGNNLWKESKVKEIEALMGRNTLKYIESTAKKMREDGWDWAPLRMLFVCKQYGRRKARLVIGCHELDSENMDCYVSVLKNNSQRLLMSIASANKFVVLIGDIKIHSCMRTVT